MCQTFSTKLMGPGWAAIIPPVAICTARSMISGLGSLAQLRFYRDKFRVQGNKAMGKLSQGIKDNLRNIQEEIRARQYR